MAVTRATPLDLEGSRLHLWYSYDLQLWVLGRASAQYFILICFSDISAEFVLAATTTADLSCTVQS